MTNNPEIQQIIEHAAQIAQEHKHGYVTLEHVLLSMITYEPFRNHLNEFGVDTDSMVSDVGTYVLNLQGIHMLPDENGRQPHPRKTAALERMFNRAVAQAIFSGRRQMDITDLYLSILLETN